MIDSIGTTSWTYNVASELTSLVTPQGTVNYEYWTDGQLKKLTNVGVGATSYTYSSTTGQLTSFVNPYTETTSFAYDSIGRLDKRTLHSGAYDKFTYDARNRVTDIDLKNSSNTALLEQEYTYDAASNVATHKKGTVTTSYGYDDANQLTSESRTGYSATYSYDDNGNRLSKTLGGVTEDYYYDNGDKLTSIKVGTTTVKSFTYDAAGNTKTITHSGATTYIDYDYENRIEDITRSGVTTNAFAYNGVSARTSITDSLGTRNIKKVGAGATAWTIGEGAISITPNSSQRLSGVTSYLHTGIKNLEATSGSSQTILAELSYDAFGQIVAQSGTIDGHKGYGARFGYHNDKDHGFKLLGHRYYDPSVGRFLTRDKIKDGRNWYGYCSNNPVVLADPSGLIPQWAKIAYKHWPSKLVDGWLKDGDLKNRVHERIGDNKLPGPDGAENDNLTEDEVVDILEDETGVERSWMTSGGSASAQIGELTPNPGYAPLPAPPVPQAGFGWEPDWGQVAVGAGIVLVGALVIGGVILTGPIGGGLLAGGGAAALIGAVIIPKPGAQS